RAGEADRDVGGERRRCERDGGCDRQASQTKRCVHEDSPRMTGIDHSGGLISTLSVPMPATVAAVLSPGLRKGPFGTPTPAGVPVSTTSPGSSVISSEARAICSATE